MLVRRLLAAHGRRPRRSPQRAHAVRPVAGRMLVGALVGAPVGLAILTVTTGRQLRFFLAGGDLRLPGADAAGLHPAPGRAGGRPRGRGRGGGAQHVAVDQRPADRDGPARPGACRPTRSGPPIAAVFTGSNVIAVALFAATGRYDADSLRAVRACRCRRSALGYLVGLAAAPPLRRRPPSGASTLWLLGVTGRGHPRRRPPRLTPPSALWLTLVASDSRRPTRAQRGRVGASVRARGGWWSGRGRWASRTGMNASTSPSPGRARSSSAVRRLPTARKASQAEARMVHPGSASWLVQVPSGDSTTMAPTSAAVEAVEQGLERGRHARGRPRGRRGRAGRPRRAGRARGWRGRRAARRWRSAPRRRPRRGSAHSATSSATGWPRRASSRPSSQAWRSPSGRSPAPMAAGRAMLWAIRSCTVHSGHDGTVVASSVGREVEGDGAHAARARPGRRREGRSPWPPTVDADDAVARPAGRRPEPRRTGHPAPGSLPG